MPTAIGVADEFVLRQTNYPGLAVIPHRRKMAWTGVIVPISADLEDMVEVLCADDAEWGQHLVHERQDHVANERKPEGYLTGRIPADWLVSGMTGVPGAVTELGVAGARSEIETYLCRSRWTEDCHRPGVTARNHRNGVQRGYRAAE